MNIDKYTRTVTASKTLVLIYGQPVTGKTTGARTFPDPRIIDIDGNLPVGTKNAIPIYEDAFVDSIKPRINPKRPANRCAVIMTIVEDIIQDTPANSTIIVDSLTRLETWYNIEEEAGDKIRSSKPPFEIDTRAMFSARLNYFNTLLTKFTACAANVVFIVHQQQDRDEKGNVTAQIKPALAGQIGEKLPGFFPILLQAQRQEDPKTKAVSFVWRTRSSLYEPARVPKPGAPDFIPQQYSELAKWL